MDLSCQMLGKPLFKCVISMDNWALPVCSQYCQLIISGRDLLPLHILSHKSNSKSYFLWPLVCIFVAPTSPKFEIWNETHIYPWESPSNESGRCCENHFPTFYQRSRLDTFCHPQETVGENRGRKTLQSPNGLYLQTQNWSLQFAYCDTDHTYK